MTDQEAPAQEFNAFEAVEYKGKDRVVHFTEYLKLKAIASGQTIFKSEFGSFDHAMGGLATGEVIVISGHRKEGKTTFAESWVRSMARVDPLAKAAIFSFEMPPTQLLEKWKEDPAMPLYLPLELEASFEWLQRRCVEAKFKYGARIIVIDHLGFMVDMATRNFSVNIGAFMRRLKLDVALKHDLAVILLVHQTQAKDGNEASVDSLYGSVTIGQDSDATVIVMRRENLNAVELKDFIAKAGEHKLHLVTPGPLADPDDNCSACLTVVKVDCHRRTGTRRWKKMFRKAGDWMVEI